MTQTVNVHQYLSNLPNDLTPINITFSAATTANQTEDMLFGKVSGCPETGALLRALDQH